MNISCKMKCKNSLTAAIKVAEFENDLNTIELEKYPLIVLHWIERLFYKIKHKINNSYDILF